ncbi:aminoacyl-tRNA hydrolase [Clostridium sp. 'deep sea']|uniref:aminoacyl-tRNA hydrolase n=1 Tax=Clostridium sp. 'deep sea' TaxID=2779445 RepID=UPI0018967468|nr:aminoacyl-tRNA hydrolase [Clostridium sp. 'deep sea']QOR34510.1 aminoacyl-tRNA hydrolase [Clostridium sp. 'deep sea']
MKYIVGLGNPGRKYENTRHNLGFAVIAKLAERLNVKTTQQKFKGLFAKTVYEGEDIVLLQPLTFMNNSGLSVAALKSFYKCDLSDILIVYDDFDFEVGKMRLRKQGSAGGHNGMKSIINSLGSSDFPRLRIGIDKPGYSQIDFVLGKFSEDEQIIIDKVIEEAVNSILCFAKEGIDKAMNKFNINIE